MDQITHSINGPGNLQPDNGHDAHRTSGDVTREDAKEAVRTILRFLGEDVTREGLRDTPRRYIDALREITSEPEYKPTTFQSEDFGGTVVQSGIAVYSMCEHHMLPIVGRATVAYVPGERIVGLSKLARCVKRHARRLQNQERISQGVVQELHRTLAPHTTACILTARHMCMEMRGVNEPGTTTTTTAIAGQLPTDEQQRDFMRLLRSRHTNE